MESNRTEARERDSVVSQGQATVTNTETKTGPRGKAACQEGSVPGSPCVEDADSGFRVGKSIRTACGAFLHPGARLPES